MDALTIAAWYGHVSILKLLISRGANVIAVDFFGETALSHAVGGSQLGACLYLVSQKADLCAVGVNGGQTILQHYGSRMTNDDLRNDEGLHPNACRARRSPFVMTLVCY